MRERLTNNSRGCIIYIGAINAGIVAAG